MFSYAIRRLLLAGLLTAVSQPHAQTAAASPVSALPAENRSAFERYRKFDDQAVESWRETNDTVFRIGGWRTYANEARQRSVGGSNPLRPAGVAAREQNGPSTPTPAPGGSKP